MWSKHILAFEGDSRRVKTLLYVFVLDLFVSSGLILVKSRTKEIDLLQQFWFIKIKKLY